MADPRAGQPAQPQDLVDLPHLVTAYYTQVPDPEVVEQQVVFGTSGHRGSSLDTAFNEWHILATTQAICDYRKQQGYDGPLFVGRDTHGLSEPAWATALEVLAANDVTVLVDSRDALHADPGGVARDPAGQQGEVASGLADGIVVTPSHNPPSDGGFKYNPPHGGPADTDATSVIAARANELIKAGLDGVRRTPFAKARAAASSYDFMGTYVDDLPAVVDLAAIKERGREDRRRPARRGVRGLLGRDRQPPRPRPDRGQPPGRRDLAVHDPRLGRQDPDGLLVAVGHGLARRPEGQVRRSRPATTPTPTGTASSRRTPG